MRTGEFVCTYDLLMHVLQLNAWLAVCTCLDYSSVIDGNLLLFLLVIWHVYECLGLMCCLRSYLLMCVCLPYSTSFFVRLCFNPLDSKGNYSAKSNNTKLVHWPLMGGLLHLVQQGWVWVGYTVPNVTAHPSTASVPITVYDGPLLCGFNVAIRGLIIEHISPYVSI